MRARGEEEAQAQEIVAKLRQVDVMTAQGTSLTRGRGRGDGSAITAAVAAYRTLVTAAPRLAPLLPPPRTGAGG